MKMPEFNNGFITALALFYGHFESFKDSPDLVMYAATDHLYDIEYPENISPELKEKIEALVDLAFSYRMSHKATKEEVYDVFGACSKLFQEIDKEVFGLEVEANYS